MDYSCLFPLMVTWRYQRLDKHRTVPPFLSIFLNMRQLIFLSLLFLVFAGNVFAQNVVPCMVVEKNDGTKTEYKLSTTPRISFSNSLVKIGTTEISVEQHFSDITKVYLSETSEEATNIEKNKVAVKIAVSNEAITMQGLEPNSDVTLYSINGNIIINQKVSNGGFALIPFYHQTHGVYILKSKNQSFKIIKK